MKYLRGIMALSASFALGACGDGVSTDQSISNVEVAENADLTNAADDAMAAADAALANAAVAVEQIEQADTEEVTFQSQLPSYSSTAYCQTIGETAGGSSVIERTCRDMEAEALNAIRGRNIPARVHSYCDDIGQTAGGSYVIYNTCVDMELEAASTL